MFDRYSNGCELSREIDAAEGMSNSVQSIRLTPMSGGAWCLPSLHPDIPFVLDNGDTVIDCNLASFALEAHALGVLLPAGKFTTTTASVKAQWEKYIASVCPGHNKKVAAADLDMAIYATPDEIIVSISAVSAIDTLRMKPLVEALNAACKGLGWWVFDVASNASREGQYPIYDPRAIADFLQQSNFSEGMTDESVIEAINDNYYGSRDQEKEFTTRQECEEENQVFWPSDLISSFGDHAWMFGANYDSDKKKYTVIGKKPFASNLVAARKFVKGRGAVELRNAVQCFIDLHEDLERPDSWMKRHDLNKVSDEDDFNGETIGASCILVWDDEIMAHDLIYHHESDLQNGGEYSENHIVYRADIGNEEMLYDLFQSTKDFVIRHTLISAAFANFEVI